MKDKFLKRLITILLALVMCTCLYVPSGSIVHAKDGDDSTTAQMRKELEEAFGDADWALQKAAIKKYANTGRLTVVLDAGHDSTHHGASRSGLKEEELTLKIAQYCKAELEQYQGVDVYLTRSSNACPNPGTSSTMDNYYRMVWASNMGADVYISLHLNVSQSAATSGVEVYAQNSGYLSAESHSLSQSIANVLQWIGLSNAGVKIRNSNDGSTYPDGSVTDYYSVNHNSKLLGFPGIIVEHAYLTNASDIRYFLGNENGLRQLGVADATGIANYYGLSKEDYSAAFDASYYYNHYGDLQEAYGYDEKALLNHFLNYGLAEGRVASPIFDIAYYKKNNQDLVAAYGNDLKKYCTHFAVYGMNEGRQGCASFNVNSYKLQYADLRQAYGNDLSKYYEHYLKYGYRENRKGTGCTSRQGYVTQYNGVDYASVYNCDYYLANNADVKNAYGSNDDIAVLQHFVNYGMNEGRQASSNFNATSYRLQYVDLRNAYGGQLKSYYEHYMRYGKKEGRVATGCTTVQGATTIHNGVDYSAVYDYYYYVANNADVKKAFGNDDVAVLQHFLNYGMKEGRCAKETFAVQSYRSRYADLQSAYGDNLPAYYMHYISYGQNEGRSGVR
jgi:N-acetylmuramoyl-L-alanine amidase